MIRTGVRSWTLVVAASFLIGATLTGCGGASSSSSQGAAGTSPTTAALNPGAAGGSRSTGAQPSIQGSAPGTASVGQVYNFQPQASGGSGALSFTIANKPGWATFSASTGQLSGTPSASDVGTDPNVEISVTDGTSVASLPTFSITVGTADAGVVQGGPGTVTLTWLPPTQYSDGTPLTSLSGYDIYYGNASQSYSQSIKVSNPGLTTYVVQNLPAGTYYFAIAAYDSTGAQSSFSPEVAAAVN